MKNIYCIIMVMAFFFLGQAEAEKDANSFSITGCINNTMSPIEIAVSDTGRASGNAEREHLLCATVTAQDGRLSQQLYYSALESPDREAGLCFARLVDMNFDGFLDLNLLTAAGSENVYTTFALWNTQEGRFDPIITLRPWLTDLQRFSSHAIQLELCNERLLPESQRIFSEEVNGFCNNIRSVYRWADERTLWEESVAVIYPANKGTVGERLEILSRDGRVCGWDQQYSMDWYYGEIQVEKERNATLDYVMLGDAITNPEIMQVAKVDWVNVRLKDTEESPSIAKLQVGSEVQVLRKGCGKDGDWVRIWYISETGGEEYTGYIRNSYLE